jgi:hypothetical protein
MSLDISGCFLILSYFFQALRVAVIVRFDRLAGRFGNHELGVVDTAVMAQWVGG